MKKLTYLDLKNTPNNDLKLLLVSLKKKNLELRFNKNESDVRDKYLYRKNRRNIARVLTLLNSKIL